MISKIALATRIWSNASIISMALLCNIPVSGVEFTSGNDGNNPGNSFLSENCVIFNTENSSYYY